MQWYLWSGVAAIEDLEDCKSDSEAFAALDEKTVGDWTLWRRNGLVATLVAIKPEGGNPSIIDLGFAKHLLTPSD